MVEEEDVVDTCWLALLVLLATMFLISAIEFCISPRLRLMSTAALDVELDCFEEEEEEDVEDEDWRAEDMRRWVEDVLAIRDVCVDELLEDEDTCLLLELLLLRSFFDHNKSHVAARLFKYFFNVAEPVRGFLPFLLYLYLVCYSRRTILSQSFAFKVFVFLHF